jgi:5'-nucleotidase
VRILVTNDDGIDSEGIRLLAAALQPLGEVVVVAPDCEYSGASAALGTLHLIRPEVHRAHIDDADEAWAITGPPALAVMFARLGAFGPRYDLVVSGINPGANVGRAVYHSGTVGAAITARNSNINAMAVSQSVSGASVEGQGWDEMLKGQRWQTAAAVAAAVAERMLADPPAPAVAVNLNVPNLPLDEVRGWRYATLGRVPERAMASAELEAKEGHPGTFRVRMGWGDPVRLSPDTDGGTVANGQVAVTLLGGFEEREPAAAPAVGAALGKLLGSDKD